MDYHSTINQSILAEFVERDVIMNASLLVSDLLGNYTLSFDEIQNYYYYPCSECRGEMKEKSDENKRYTCTNCDHQQDDEPEQEAREIYEWWFVTEWLFEKLDAAGQPVINSPYGFLWGRCATGQAILLDGVIGRIAEEMEILAGQRNDWSKQ